MPTTSVKSARLYLNPSLLARATELTVSALIVWVVLISPIPLAATLFLLLLLCRQKHQASPDGLLKLSYDGDVQWKKVCSRFGYADLSFRPLLIVIHCTCGLKVTVWRDACSEDEYRHLLVVISLMQKTKRGEP